MTEKLKKSKGQGRTGQITIRIDPNILEDLGEIADLLGIAQSTLAGLAIGEYVTKSKAAFINPTVMYEAMGKEMAQQISNPIMEVFKGKTLEEMKAIVDKIND